MEHVSDDRRACRELTRVLKKGGTIAITVPTYTSEALNDAITYEYYSSRRAHPALRARKLAAIMEECGLEVYGVRFKHSCTQSTGSSEALWPAQQRSVHHKKIPHLLTLGLYSKIYPRVEAFFDNFFPKASCSTR
jgi:ubiquinone/menaquinone biosynthesis C-methylase UbiE